jgi:Fe-S-cluster containining protein
VNQDEINALANALGFDDVEKFEDRYVRRIGVRRSLVEFPNGDCVFFDNGTRKCTVYEYRPRQCRSWPFWDSNLKSPAAWDATCEVCPGSGKGRLYSLGQIEKQRAAIRI